jgi:hypothetical protein
MLMPVRSAFVPLVAVTVLLGAGCGSSGGGNGGSTAAQTSASAASGAATTTASTSHASTGTSTAAGPAPAQTSTSATAPRRAGAGEHVQSYGTAASASEQAAVTSTVKAYYAAVAADRGTTACALLSTRIQGAIVRSLGHSALLQGKGCATILTVLFRHPAGQAGAISPAVTVTGLRVSGDQGYALISTKAKPKGDIRVEREHGAWKVAALIGSALS